MANNVLTVRQYADIVSCTTKNIYNQMYASRELPGISYYVKTGNTYFLFATKAFISTHSKHFAQMLQK